MFLRKTRVIEVDHATRLKFNTRKGSTFHAARTCAIHSFETGLRELPKPRLLVARVPTLALPCERAFSLRVPRDHESSSPAKLQ